MAPRSRSTSTPAASSRSGSAMASPVVIGQVVGFSAGMRGANRLPPGNPGDHLYWIYSYGTNNATPASLWPGWTLLAQSRAITNGTEFAPWHGVAYRVADGTEGRRPDGSIHPYVELNLGQSTSMSTASIVLRVSGAEHPSITPPVISTVARNAGASSTLPNSSAPTAGASADRLFFSTVGHSGSGLGNLVSTPANYGATVLSLTDLTTTAAGQTVVN